MPPISLPLSRIINPPRAHAAILSNVSLRDEVADFEVEEIPQYQPEGSGEHLFLWVEKRDVAAGDLITLLARQLGVAQRDIGIAGQKDRRAVTRQFFSVPAKCASRLLKLDIPGISVLSSTLHKNKLRTGHLKGNRFIIRLRSSVPLTSTDADAVQQRLAELERTGFPNYYGPQRFGRHGKSLRDGVAMLTESSNDTTQTDPDVNETSSSEERDVSARPALARKRGFLNMMTASAVQSAVFNLVLADRVTSGTYKVPQSGDIVCSQTGIRPFAFDERGETPAEGLVPMGPMPGPKMLQASGEPLASELAAMQQIGLTMDDFERNKKFTQGVRRRFVEFPTSTSAALTDDGAVEVRFELSSGCFATVLLAEVCADIEG